MKRQEKISAENLSMLMLDVNNFDNFTEKEYVTNLERLRIASYSELIGENVWYCKKGYGEHKVEKWDADRAEYLLNLEGDKFWSNPFKIHRTNDSKTF